MRPEGKVWRKATRRAARAVPGGTGRRHGTCLYVIARREAEAAARLAYINRNRGVLP